MSRLSNLIIDTQKIVNVVCKCYNESPAAKAAGLFKSNHTKKARLRARFVETSFLADEKSVGHF